jgi:hypothetical protein
MGDKCGDKPVILIIPINRKGYSGFGSQKTLSLERNSRKKFLQLLGRAAYTEQKSHVPMHPRVALTTLGTI